jgi:hypothetical protein
LIETQYTFKFSATSPSSLAVGSAQITKIINLPPFGGKLVSNVPSARSLEDTIRLTTSGWIDTSDDLPLRYTFYQVVEFENGETIDQPLHPFPQSKSEFSFIAPVVEKDTIVTFKVIAFDNKNAGSSATTTVNILAFQKPNNETNENFAEQLMNQNLQQLLNEGNFERIIQYIDNVAQVLRLSTGTDPESIQKRVLLKEKLVELYNSVFSSNVNFINGDLRKSVISTFTKLQLSQFLMFLHLLQMHILQSRLVMQSMLKVQVFSCFFKLKTIQQPLLFIIREKLRLVPHWFSISCKPKNKLFITNRFEED